MAVTANMTLVAPGAALTLQALKPVRISLAQVQADKATHKRAVEAEVGKARNAPGLQTRDNGRGRIKAQIQEIAKRLKLLKAMYANDPKGMAKALAGVFRELRAAVKEYKALMKDELGMAGDAAATVIPPDSATPPPSDAAADTPAKPDPGVVNYDEVNAGIKKALGDDGLAFLKETLAGVFEIEDKYLSPARIQMKAAKRDKDTDDAFEDVENELKALKQDIRDLQGDIHHAVPEAGQMVSLSA